MLQPPNEWLAGVVAESVSELAVILGQMRKDGATPDDFVFVVVDASDASGRAFALQISATFGAADQRLISAIPKNDLLAMLLAMKADALAARIRDDVKPPSSLTVLAVARGMAQSANMPLAFLPPPKTAPEPGA